MQQVLFILVGCATELDQRCRENDEEYLQAQYWRSLKIMDHLYRRSVPQFIGFLKTSFISMMTFVWSNANGGNGLIQKQPYFFPKFYKDFLTFSKNVGFSTGQDMSNISELLASALCEVIAVSLTAHNEKTLSVLFDCLFQIAPTNVAVDILAKHLACSAGKAQIRRITDSYLAEQLKNLSNDYEINYERTNCNEYEKKEQPQQAAGEELTGKKGNMHSSSTTRAMVNAKLLTKSFNTTWATIFDAIMLDPAETVRVSILISASKAIQETISTRLFHEN